MSHPSKSEQQPSPSESTFSVFSYVDPSSPRELELEHDLYHNTHSKNLNRLENDGLPLQSTGRKEHIQTGITYLPLPEPRLQVIQPRQSFDYKQHIEQDFYMRYQYFSNERLDQILQNIDASHAERYKTSYQRLHQSLLSSIVRSIDLDEEITQMKYSILHKHELLPVLLHNHRLAKREKQVLYHLASGSWRKFDQYIQTEINVQYQLEQIRQQHQALLNMKIKQEQYRKFYNEIQEINNEMVYLKTEIQQLHDDRAQLRNELHESRTRCSHYLIQLNVLKSHIARAHTNELNNLQLERDSLITQTELIRYNLFEQLQQFDHLVYNYRLSLNSFRLTLSELEHQLKRETDDELNHLQIFSPLQRQTITNDTQHLIAIVENKITEKKSINSQLEKAIEQVQEKLLKLKQSSIKRENDYQAMADTDQQLTHGISIQREIYLQLKNERRVLERQLASKLKQFSIDDRLTHTLTQQHETFFARKKLEQTRAHTFREQIHPLLDENHRLKHLLEQLYRQSTQLNPNHLLQLRREIDELRQSRHTLVQQRLQDQHTKTKYDKDEEQLQRKSNRVATRIRGILNRMKVNDISFKDNHEHLRMLEDKLTQEQHYHLQSQYLLTGMKKRAGVSRAKQHSLQMQIQVAFNNIRHSQHRLEAFTDQLSAYGHGFVEQQTSLNTLRAFCATLKEKNESSSKQLYSIHSHHIHLQNQYQLSVQSLGNTREELAKYSNMRSIFGRMIVRRVDLCQLLYKKLAHYDAQIHQQEQHVQMTCQCIRSLKTQIRQIREENKKCVAKKDQIQLETVKVHVERMLDDSHEKQRSLAKEIFQRRFYDRHSTDRLPREEWTLLSAKFELLKSRLVKIVCRAILCDLVLVAIQQEYASHLQCYTSKTHREAFCHLTSIRTNLYQIMQQLKARTAESNMLTDYRSYVQSIHTDIIRQIIPWQNSDSTNDIH